MAYSLDDGIPSFVLEVDFLKGAKGDSGFSPRIEIAKLTSAEYVLKIVNENGEFYTPNLKTDFSMEDYVLKEEGKGLSTNSFEDEEKQKLQALHNYDDTDLRNEFVEVENRMLANIEVSKGELESSINQSKQDTLDEVDEKISNLETLPTGGTTGQVLSKASDANGDALWCDIEANEVHIGSVDTAPDSAKIIVEDDDMEEVEDDGEVYSTEEQVVGTWIDGKPIYRKCFTGALSQTERSVFIDNTNNKDKLISTKGFIFSNVNEKVFFEIGKSALNDRNTNLTAQLTRVIIVNNFIRLDYAEGLNQCSYEIAVEYTKTTDQGGNV